MPPTTPTYPAPALPPRPKHRWWIWTIVLVIVAVLIALGLNLSGKIEDSLVITRADPAMVKLTQEGQFTHAGELMFLRNHPQYATEAQLTQNCPPAAGFSVQGCYLSKTHQIYILRMPAQLSKNEVVTAAYEMLHPVYDSLSGAQLTAVNQAVEATYKSLNDPTLNQTVSGFVVSEPGAQDNELFSLLGTQYTNLPSVLNDEYNLYLGNRALIVANYTQISGIFKSSLAQLDQLKSTIATDNSEATVAYNTSVQWANAGNASQDNYYYNIYVQKLAAANAVVGQYNQLLRQYNALVAQFSGQPLSQIQAQSQQSK